MSYDNTNKGAVFVPFTNQHFILQGKLNVEGNEVYVAVLKQPLKRDSDPVLVVYKQAAILYPNDKGDNERRPDYSGPITDRADLQLAAWKGEKDGKKYLQLKVSEKQGDAHEGGGGQKGGGNDGFQDDEIPF